MPFLHFFANKCGIGWSAVEYMGGSAGGEGAALGLLHIHGFLDVIASLPDVILPQITIGQNHGTTPVVLYHFPFPSTFQQFLQIWMLEKGAQDVVAC